MLTNSSALFLDEIITRLDATSAFQFICILKALTQKDRIIIVIIHQSRSKIWDLFDHLFLLFEDFSLYSEEVQECLSYFVELDYFLSLMLNSIEYLIDLTAVDTRFSKLKAIFDARVESLKQAWK
jgi:ABC-type multidrug transport system ATPase subunit